MLSIIYILLSILGLSFLIFIHELGHYWMAKRVGMRVETFSIGFGKPIYQWINKDGVKWQIGWLLFGGFVKIAGMDGESKDPYAISDGFFGKSAWDRIKVAFMGPFVNLIFALFIFTLIWMGGGREKNFAEFTQKIGWVDPKSELYIQGVRPGDEVSTYNDQPYVSYKDHILAPMLNPDQLEVRGNHIDYQTSSKSPFELEIKPYHNPLLVDGILTSGILQPTSYVIYNRFPSGNENPLPEGSPMLESGIQYGDRILWVDGHLIFSNMQLSHLLNDERVLLTIQRGEEILLKRVPRVLALELKPNTEFREEMIDWQYAAGFKERTFQKLYAIPYNLTHDAIVENQLDFIDRENQEDAFPSYPNSDLELPLIQGDKIIAVAGTPISASHELLAKIQELKVNVIIQRDSEAFNRVAWYDAETNFNQNFNKENLIALTSGIGSENSIKSVGNLHLLKPITPKIPKNFPMSAKKKAWFKTELLERQKKIESIEDPEKRATLLEILEEQQNRYVLGIPNIQDRKVQYNPTPTTQFMNIITEIGGTVSALFTGSLSPKFLAGPIGIVHAVHESSRLGLLEALFWMGAISLNLGILNLLPIPVLDGGTIVLSFFEMITGKQLKPKTMEKLIIPFAVLLVGLFVFLTYNDLLRLFGDLLR